MKKLIDYIKRFPMIVILIIILLFFTPLAVFSPGENRNRGVVTAIGLDFVDNEYEVSLLTFIPTANQTYKQKNSVISGKGKSVVDAISKASIAMGRDVGLAHAKTTVVSESMLAEDIAESLSLLAHIASLPENTVFVCTNTSAKEMLQNSQNLVDELGLQLEQVISYNANELYVTDTSLEAFYKGYYSFLKSSLIGYIPLIDSEDTNTDSSVSSSQNTDTSQQEVQGDSSPQGGAQSSQSKKKILNEGEAVLLKSGKMVEKLSTYQLSGINLLNPKDLNQLIKINDVNLNGSIMDLTYRLKDKKVLTTTKFENGYPVFYAKLILSVELVETEGADENTKSNTEYSEITPEIANKIEEQINKKYVTAVNLLRKNGTDVIGVTSKFFRNNRKDYKKFIENHDTPDNFIKYVTFKLTTVVQPD
mgnify:FL=1